MNDKKETKCGSTKVGSRGQIVIPQEIREKFEIKEGETLFVVEDGDNIKIMKMDVIKKVLDLKE